MKPPLNKDLEGYRNPPCYANTHLDNTSTSTHFLILASKHIPNATNHTLLQWRARRDYQTTPNKEQIFRLILVVEEMTGLVPQNHPCRHGQSSVAMHLATTAVVAILPVMTFGRILHSLRKREQKKRLMKPVRFASKFEDLVSLVLLLATATQQILNNQSYPPWRSCNNP